jgi:hypothetical protein
MDCLYTELCSLQSGRCNQVYGHFCKVDAACGSTDQKSSHVAQLIDISVTTQSTADTRSVYTALREIYDSADAKGTIPADQLFSILSSQK